jgi:hypothetical protein
MSKNTEADALASHLRALETSLLQPDVRKSKQLVALLAEEFIEFGTSGRVYTKEDLGSVWQKRVEEWQMVFHQSTRTTEEQLPQ